MTVDNCHLRLIYLIKMVIFHGHVSLPEGIPFQTSFFRISPLLKVIPHLGPALPLLTSAAGRAIGDHLRFSAVAVAKLILSTKNNQGMWMVYRLLGLGIHQP